jgi:hypothetical protein
MQKWQTCPQAVLRSVDAIDRRPTYLEGRGSVYGAISHHSTTGRIANLKIRSGTLAEGVLHIQGKRNLFWMSHMRGNDQRDNLLLLRLRSFWAVWRRLVETATEIALSWTR